MVDISKLPKWAQSRIKVLESEIAERDRRIAALTGEKETRIKIEGFNLMPDAYLDNRVILRYQIDNNKLHYIDVGLNMHHPGCLSIYSSGVGELAFLPGATNHGLLTIIDDHNK
jgi:hypothetical protein